MASVSPHADVGEFPMQAVVSLPHSIHRSPSQSQMAQCTWHAISSCMLSACPLLRGLGHQSCICLVLVCSDYAVSVDFLGLLPDSIWLGEVPPSSGLTIH